MPVKAEHARCAFEFISVTTEHGFTGIGATVADAASTASVDPQRAAHRFGDDRWAARGGRVWPLERQHATRARPRRKRGGDGSVSARLVRARKGDRRTDP